MVRLVAPLRPRPGRADRQRARPVPPGDGDALGYEVSYRRMDDTRWRSLRKGLTDPVLAWDTTTVPNGRYVIRVTASDSPSNPESLALSSEKESDPFDVDNTPPTVSLILV